MAPVDWNSLSSATLAAFVLHMGAGTTALVSGTVALGAAKGGTLHRRAGTVFAIAMLTMAISADYLAVVRPGQVPNLLVGTFTLYLIITAWLTVHRSDGEPGGLIEKGALAVILCLFLPFALLSLQLATGMTPFLKSATPFEGPVLIAIYVFTLITGIAVVADIKVLLKRGISGRARIERHLWRMCLGLAMAAGSAFTNGLPRLLPTGVHVPLLWLFMPQFIVFGVLFFWLIRVRLTGWYEAGPPSQPVGKPAGPMSASSLSPQRPSPL